MPALGCRYCVCSGAGDGIMVRCDNGDCPSGAWFHLGCVNLAEAPDLTAKWYCEGCDAAM